jgi:hypothetical protein
MMDAETGDQEEAKDSKIPAFGRKRNGLVSWREIRAMVT